MEYWFVQHDIDAYWDRPNAIGSPKTRALRDRNFRQMHKGDKVVYYAKGKRTLGLFQISEPWLELKNWSKSRKGPYMTYQIKPIYAGIFELDPSDFGIGTTRGKTVIHLTKEQYRKMAAHILGMEDPENHEGTVALFAKLHRACGFPRLLKTGEAYPDIRALDEDGHETRIEVEFESASFEREHMNEVDKCDMIVCWKDTWGRAAIKPVVDLASLLY
ncbi:hypothetical protein MUP05_03650 [Candidatus Bathyarchaeota archaeon]|nr:hypothetical protein [Candidatus Bathyarchaeota archaeon]